VLRAGWSLVWRRQRLLWWIYLVGLALAFLAAQALTSALSPVLDNSLASDRLYRAFDLGLFAELLSRPDAPGASTVAASVLAIFVFLVLMLLFTGGVLRVYNEDRTFATGEFFGACGNYFWRFFRLVILLLIVLIPVELLNAGIKAWSGSLADRIASPTPSLVVSWGGTLLVLFLLISVRAWFDLAEVHAVAEDERAIRRSFGRAFRLTWRNFRSLFWIYFAPSFLAWIVTIALLWFWAASVPHQAVTLSFLITQFIVFFWIFARLWQRASETLWYQANAPVPVEYTAPIPQPESSLMEFPLAESPGDVPPTASNPAGETAL